MAFDPTKPAANSPVSSAELRSQFNGLKAQIDAIPPGATVTQLNEATQMLSEDIGAVQAALDAGLAATALNPAVDGLGMVVGGPPTQAEVQALADKLDELIAALKR